VSEQAADPFDDRQAQAGAPVVAVTFVEAAELLEDLAQQALGNAGALIVDFDAQGVAVAPATEQDAALPG